MCYTRAYRSDSSPVSLGEVWAAIEVSSPQAPQNIRIEQDGMNQAGPWILIWAVALGVGLGAFYLIALAVIPLGARDIWRLFRDLDAADKNPDKNPNVQAAPDKPGDLPGGKP